MDDFLISGKKKFLDKTVKLVSDELKISKVEKDSFRFTGIDIVKKGQQVEVSMEDYADTIKKIPVFRQDVATSKLNEVEMKMFRKYVGKVLWLAENVRPDLAYMALEMSQKIKGATLKDLKMVNFVVERINERDNKVVYKKVGDRHDLVVKTISDASYFKDKPSVGGSIILLANKKNDRVAPLYWKSKSISKVCVSSKDAETRACFRNVNEGMYTAELILSLIHI